MGPLYPTVNCIPLQIIDVILSAALKDSQAFKCFVKSCPFLRVTIVFRMVNVQHFIFGREHFDLSLALATAIMSVLFQLLLHGVCSGGAQSVL